LVIGVGALRTAGKVFDCWRLNSAFVLRRAESLDGRVREVLRPLIGDRQRSVTALSDTATPDDAQVLR